MKTIHLIMSTFICSNLIGQTPPQLISFKTEDFTNISARAITWTNKIFVNGLLDLNFYKNYFYIPYYFPDKLIDSTNKNKTVTIWKDTIEKRDFQSNWTHTFQYDENSRVIVYTFSGCIICSNLPYTIKLFYDNYDKVVKMEKYNKLEIPYVDSLYIRKQSLQQPNETFIFKYDKSGNIVQLEYFVNEVLNKRISKK